MGVPPSNIHVRFEKDLLRTVGGDAFFGKKLTHVRTDARTHTDGGRKVTGLALLSAGLKFHSIQYQH